MSSEGLKDVDYIFDHLVGGGHLWQWRTTAVITYLIEEINLGFLF